MPKKTLPPPEVIEPDQEIAITPLPLRELNPREKRFAEEYVSCLSGPKAAIAAGYSEKRARQTSWEKKRDPAVAAYIEKLQAEARRRSGVTADAIYMELARIALSDMTEFAQWDEDGVALVPSDELPPGAGRVVKEITMTKEGPKLKLEDRTPALVRLGQENGMFIKRVDTRLGRMPETELSDAELARIIEEGDE